MQQLLFSKRYMKEDLEWWITISFINCTYITKYWKLFLNCFLQTLFSFIFWNLWIPEKRVYYWSKSQKHWCKCWLMHDSTIKQSFHENKIQRIDGTYERV
jgi:hypothetical protein